MKRAPRSRQRHDLYAKYHDYDSEISDLLGECGFQRVAELSFGEMGYQAALRGEDANLIERTLGKQTNLTREKMFAARERINETCANRPGAEGTADSLSGNYSAISDEVRRRGRFDFDRVLELCAVSATRQLGSLPEMLREINLADRK